MGNIYKIKDKHIDIMTDPDVSVDALARIGTNNCYKYIIRILVFIIKFSSNHFHFIAAYSVQQRSSVLVKSGK